MPEKPWSQELIDHLTRCVADIIEYADLSDDASDALMAIVIPKLVQRSGLGYAKFHAMTMASCAALRREVLLEAVPASPLRHCRVSGSG
jgi:hypothetical protein